MHNPETGKRHVSSEARDEYDSFWTPAYAVFAMLDALGGAKFFGSTIVEPACGAGHISRALKSRGFRVESTDLRKPALYGRGGVDFLRMKSCPYSVITNPPYKLLTEFMEHALHLQVPAAAFLAPLYGLKGKSRYHKVFDRAPGLVVMPFTSGIRQWKESEKRWVTGGAFTHAWIVLTSSDKILGHRTGSRSIQWLNVTNHSPLDVKEVRRA